MKAEIVCPLCKVSIATLQGAQVEEAVKLFKSHLPSHTLSEIYDFNVWNASQLFPLINWDHGKSNTATS